MMYNADVVDSCAAGNEAALLEREFPEVGLAETVAMELPSGSGLRVFGTLFPARTAGARAAIGATNELHALEGAETTPGERMWLTVPYGIYAHPRGTQVVDEKSALEMTRHFRQIWARVARGFRGLPVYIGHPDARGRTPEEQAALDKAYPDKDIHGWIEVLEAGDDGLRLRLRWELSGEELVRQGKFAYFSPHWGMLPILEQPGMYRPVELYSLGLTNHPNIPGLRLKKAGNTQMLPTPAALDTESEAGADLVVVNEVEAPTEEERLREALQMERRARCESAVDRALSEGRITLAGREQWLRNLELDFAGNERLINLLPAVWNTVATNPVRKLGAQREFLDLERTLSPRVRPLGDPSPSRRRPDRIERIAREVARRQSATTADGGRDRVTPGFNEIYQGVKKDHPEWFTEA